MNYNKKIMTTNNKKEEESLFDPELDKPLKGSFLGKNFKSSPFFRGEQNKGSSFGINKETNG